MTGPYPQGLILRTDRLETPTEGCQVKAQKRRVLVMSGNIFERHPTSLVRNPVLYMYVHGPGKAATAGLVSQVPHKTVSKRVPSRSHTTKSACTSTFH